MTDLFIFMIEAPLHHDKDSKELWSVLLIVVDANP